MKRAPKIAGARAERRKGVGGAVACLLVAVLIAAGCSRYHEDEWSRARPRTIRAGGVVEYRGKPVEGAIVTFIARVEDRGREYDARGYTDPQGRFRLKTFRQDDGAVAGSHKVRIEKTAMEEVSGGDARNAARPPQLVHHLPTHYGSFDTSGLTAEVTEKGPNEFVFKLDDSGPAPKPRR